MGCGVRRHTWSGVHGVTRCWGCLREARLVQPAQCDFGLGQMAVHDRPTYPLHLGQLADTEPLHDVHGEQGVGLTVAPRQALEAVVYDRERLLQVVCSVECRRRDAVHFFLQMALELCLGAPQPSVGAGELMLHEGIL